MQLSLTHMCRGGGARQNNPVVAILRQKGGEDEESNLRPLGSDHRIKFVQFSVRHTTYIIIYQHVSYLKVCQKISMCIQ